jgi:hypothetical protein
MYVKSGDEIVDWLDNTVIKPNGYRVDHVVNKDKEMVKQWDHDNKMMSEKNDMLNASSFESIILFIMQKDSAYIKKLEIEYINMREQHDKMIEKIKQLSKQEGGSTTLQVVEDFLKIDCNNVHITKKVIMNFHKILYKTKGKYDGKNIVEDLGEHMCEYFKDMPDLKNKLMYSSRTRVFDIWNITIFLLSLKREDLKTYYYYIMNENKIQALHKRKMEALMNKLKKKKST